MALAWFRLLLDLNNIDPECERLILDWRHFRLDFEEPWNSFSKFLNLQTLWNHQTFLKRFLNLRASSLNSSQVWKHTDKGPYEKSSPILALNFLGIIIITMTIIFIVINQNELIDKYFLIIKKFIYCMINRSIFLSMGPMWFYLKVWITCEKISKPQRSCYWQMTIN